jgi:hypothetical protein
MKIRKGNPRELCSSLMLLNFSTHKLKSMSLVPKMTYAFLKRVLRTNIAIAKWTLSQKTSSQTRNLITNIIKAKNFHKTK